MKKTLSILLIAVLVVAVSMTTVFAVTSFTVGLSAKATTVERGKTAEVTIDLKNFAANETGINSIKFTIDYDKTVFNTLTTADLANKGGWGVPTFNPTTGETVMDHSAYMSTNHDMLTIKFTVKDTAALGNTTVTVKDVNASDSTADIYPANQSITLTVKEAAAGNNTNTNTATKNPSTGIADYTIPAILVISAVALLGYARYRKIK